MCNRNFSRFFSKEMHSVKQPMPTLPKIHLQKAFGDISGHLVTSSEIVYTSDIWFHVNSEKGTGFAGK